MAVGLILLSLVASPCEAEFYCGGYIGKAFLFDQDIHINQPSLGNKLTFKDISFDDNSFEPPLYYGAKAGYFFPSLSCFGIEAEFIHLKVVADTDRVTKVSGTRSGGEYNQAEPLGEIVQRFDITHGANLLTLNLVGRLGYFKQEAFPKGRLQPYAGIGLGGALLHAENEIDKKKRQQYEWDGPVVQPFIGAKIFFLRHIACFAEYKFSYGKFSVAINQGEGTVAVAAQHLVLGTAVHF